MKAYLVAHFVQGTLLCIFASPLLAQNGPAELNPDSAGDAWVIVPGERFGPITRQTTQESLIELFGDEAVQREEIPVGEGMSVPGTVVFPDIPDKRISIRWHDEENGRYPRVISISGTTSLWKTQRGITLGTPAKELERLNGKPFRMTGFGWDYAGTVLDADGGALRELGNYDGVGEAGQDRVLKGRSLILRLGPDPSPGNEISQEEYMTILGDQELLSDHPTLQKVTLKVEEMLVEFRDE